MFRLKIQNKCTQAVRKYLQHKTRCNMENYIQSLFFLCASMPCDIENVEDSRQTDDGLSGEVTGVGVGRYTRVRLSWEGLHLLWFLS